MKYRKCPILDEEDLNELNNLIDTNSNSQDKQNFAFIGYQDGQDEPDKFKKFMRFSSYLGNLNIDKDTTDITNIIFNILTQYPYHKNKYEQEEMWCKYYEFKANRISEDQYLLLIKGKYTEIKDSNRLLEYESEAFTKIIEVLNAIINIKQKN